MAISAAQAAGASARKLRLDADATLTDVAKAARFCGLPWTTGRVAAFESGHVTPSVTTLYAVAAALSAVTGRPVTLADLFAREDPVALTDRLTVDPAKLRAALAGEPVVATLGDLPADEQKRFKARMAEAVSTEGWPEHLAYMTWGRIRRVWQDFSETDERMCKNIGVSQFLGAAAMAKLWNKAFTAKRDELAELAGPNVNAQKLGQISRQLKAELLGIIQGEAQDG